MVAIFRFGRKRKKPFGQTDAKQAAEKPIPSSLSQCEKLIRDIFSNSADLDIYTFQTTHAGVMLVHMDGLVNKDLVDRDIIAPLKSERFTGDLTSSITTNQQRYGNLNNVIDDIVNGSVAIFHEGSKWAITVDIKQWDHRKVETPSAEVVIRGPKEAFNEDIRTNTALVRRKIRNPGLIVEKVVLGRQTNTTIELLYMNGIVNRDVLAEVKRRLEKIDTSAILESGYIEHYIEENTYSPISGIGLTQKPDVLAEKILGGRVAILCDGTPHALFVPELFIENIQTGEDMYNRVLYANFSRLLRFFGVTIGVMLPGLAVAFITYNQEMIPSVFLVKLISSTQNTPLPAAAEAFLLIIMFELIKEAGTRLPQAVGSAITIVGSLIIGQSAVNAGIVSAPMVIIIALTAVSSFIVPNLNEFIMIYRLFFLLMGSLMGIIGIGAAAFIEMTQLIATKSFGIPIIASFSQQDIKNSLIRLPYKFLKFRPTSIAQHNVRKQK